MGEWMDGWMDGLCYHAAVRETVTFTVMTLLEQTGAGIILLTLPGGSTLQLSTWLDPLVVIFTNFLYLYRHYDYDCNSLPVESTD